MECGILKPKCVYTPRMNIDVFFKDYFFNFSTSTANTLTFDEALSFKNVFKNFKITFDGIEYDILVVPGHRVDFQRYCDHYPKSGFNDNTALEYSTDKTYQLMALHLDDVAIRYKKIG